MEKSIVCLLKQKKSIEELQSNIEQLYKEQYQCSMVSEVSEAVFLVSNLIVGNGYPAVLIVDQMYLEACSFLMEILKDTLPKCQVIVLSDDLHVPKSFINQYEIKRCVKAYTNDVLMVLENCLKNYELDFEKELEVKKIENIAYQKDLILSSISKEMLFISPSLDMVWQKGVDYELDNIDEGKCYSVLRGRDKPCDFCECMDALNNNQIISSEHKIGNRVKAVTYHPVIDKHQNDIGVFVRLSDITEQKAREKMNKVLLEMSKTSHKRMNSFELYRLTQKLIHKVMPVSYMCLCGKDFDGAYVAYLQSDDPVHYTRKNIDYSGDYVQKWMMLTQYNKTDMEPYELYFNSRSNALEFVAPMNDRLLVFKFPDRKSLTDEQKVFLCDMIEYLSIGIQRIENLKKITYQANHDLLTDLYNRDYFAKAVENVLSFHREKELKQQYALALVDLNYFKDINDTYGHSSGDEVLYLMARNTANVLRHGDIMARFGGDEFALLLTYRKKEELIVVLSRIQEAISKSIVINECRVSVGSAIGVVSDISGYTKASDVMSDADIAMYEAKQVKTGIGSIRYFEKEIEEKLKMSKDIQGRLSKAVRNKEFKLNYQPIRDLSSESTIGFEALLRWQSDDKVHHSPAEFLPIAEDSGYIYKISDDIFKSVINAMSLLDEYFIGNELFISINMSVKQLMNMAYLEKLPLLDIDFSRIVIEITEKSMIKNFDKAIKHINYLRSLGIRVYLDDYGTGYTSLSHLYSDEIDEVKIDRQLIHQMLVDEDVARVVESIIQVAQKMNKEVIAEGIENESQLQMLKSLGCNYGQGFHFSKPMTLDQLIIEHAMEV